MDYNYPTLWNAATLVNSTVSFLSLLQDLLKSSVMEISTA